MTAPRYVSACCGADIGRRSGCCAAGGIETLYDFCSACGQPCTPMPADVRERIVAEGMRRAADYISGGKKPTDESLREFRGADLISRRVCATAIRRAADALVADATGVSAASTDMEATDGREPA